MLTQGVTTKLLNPDGGGRLDIAEQLPQAAARGLAVNIGAYTGFNSAWTSIVGEADRRPTTDDIVQMRDILVRNLEAGPRRGAGAGRRDERNGRRRWRGCRPTARNR